jgi:hypothetical protein
MNFPFVTAVKISGKVCPGQDFVAIVYRHFFLGTGICFSIKPARLRHAGRHRRPPG